MLRLGLHVREEGVVAAVVEVEDLRKSYGAVRAVDGVSFRVDEGEIFGIVGPNGAGKTTTIECMEGLRRPDRGRVRVFGLDPLDRLALAQRIGVQLQQAALPGRLRVGEALDLFASFCARPADPDELLATLGLADKRAAPFAKLSGGQKQRLFIALALVGAPDVVFFDELTTGLDPQARRRMWDLVRDVRARGCTVVLTTHFMEEAERLCDRVLIMDGGRIVALDAPAALVAALGAEKRLAFSLPAGRSAPDLAALPAVERVEVAGERVTLYGRGDRFASSVVAALEDAGLDFRDLRTEQPNLEDVFLTLTGREMRA
jgi:ABC-2 type transport system ATP-binding protein